MYILVKGTLSVLKKMGGGERELNRILPGECFGEIALISQEGRYAKIKALTYIECLEISESDFTGLMNGNHEFDQGVMRILINRLKYSENQASKNILNAYHALIFSLANLAESRDPETGAHLNRVQNYCSRLSELLSALPEYREIISPKFIKNIYIVSPLHDIGKVGIPDSMLLKPGKLTREEFAVMKCHCTIGAMTLEKVVQVCPHLIFQQAYNIALNHHERYDGKGYPNGLSGNKIPVEARIMALADVYDALLSKRVYKEPYGYKPSARIIQEGAGSQFDPVIAQVMLDNISDFEKIHQMYDD